MYTTEQQERFKLFFNEYWNLTKKYLINNQGMTEKEWELFVLEIELLEKNYKTDSFNRLVRDLLLSLTRQLESEKVE